MAWTLKWRSTSTTTRCDPRTAGTCIGWCLLPFSRRFFFWAYVDLLSCCFAPSLRFLLPSSLPLFSPTSRCPFAAPLPCLILFWFSHYLSHSFSLLYCSIFPLSTSHVRVALCSLFISSPSKVMDVMDRMFVHIFRGLSTRFAKEIEAVHKQFHREPFKWLEPT